ncbi:uncharacterized protein EI90DRAFT_3012893 [Cantharellus anzutake]|uniref:uncharacterized protein n=1 Tax=Cantharellus anzutake TaxID=1750568 RepID=UPI001906ED44|nr:uncharacterized protein EI90DRAFT_3012893 [Cantharellus anzutake]KAF8340005.1 hypothetical protein EI90DRAFT_3012893 [Cantharellus anzutake]
MARAGRTRWLLGNKRWIKKEFRLESVSYDYCTLWLRHQCIEQSSIITINQPQMMMSRKMADWRWDERWESPGTSWVDWKKWRTEGLGEASVWRSKRHQIPGSDPFLNMRNHLWRGGGGVMQSMAQVVVRTLLFTFCGEQPLRTYARNIVCLECLGPLGIINAEELGWVGEEIMVDYVPESGCFTRPRL